MNSPPNVSLVSEIVESSVLKATLCTLGKAMGNFVLHRYLSLLKANRKEREDLRKVRKEESFHFQ